jgi:tetratricopeptide (TPR) repeat protein
LAIAEICYKLDGLPLTIELAAARIKLFDPQALLTRLSHRLRELTRGPRDAPTRQRTLRATLDWSYNLLTTGEKTLFTRLGMFVGGCTLEAAEAVYNAPGDLSVDVADGIAALLDKSLLRREESVDGEPRFMMLETIREYAQEKLRASGENEIIRQRHIAYYLALTEAAEPMLTGPQQGIWLARLEVEHNNLRAALGWALEREAVEITARLNAVLWRLWDVHGHYSEGRQWLEATLRQNINLPLHIGGKVLTGAGVLAYRQGDYTRATILCEEALPLVRKLGDRYHSIFSLIVLASTMMEQGNYIQANARFQELLLYSQKHEVTWGIARALTGLGTVAIFQGEYAQAYALNEKGLLLHRETGDTWGIVYSLTSLGFAVLFRGDIARSAALFMESLELHQKIGDKVILPYCLDGLALAAASQGQPLRAARLFGMAEAFRDSIGAAQAVGARILRESAITSTRTQLGETAFADAWTTGRAITIEQATTCAVEEAISIYKCLPD